MYSRFNAAIAGRAPKPRGFDLDVSSSKDLWLVVRDTGSNAPERVNPVWVNAVLVDADGAETPLSSLAPHIESDRPRHTTGGLVYVRNPSVLRYSLDGKQFVRLRGAVDVANLRSEIGSTLNPSLRFFIFDTAPDPGTTLAAGTDAARAAAPHAGRRTGSRGSRLLAGPRSRAVGGRASGRRAGRRRTRTVLAGSRRTASPTCCGRVLMKPEFQLIY